MRIEFDSKPVNEMLAGLLYPAECDYASQNGGSAFGRRKVYYFYPPRGLQSVFTACYNEHASVVTAFKRCSAVADLLAAGIIDSSRHSRKEEYI